MTIQYKKLNQEQKQAAASHNTSDAIWSAILAIATEQRSAEAIWEDPTGDEIVAVQQIITDWANAGHIEGSHVWGCGMWIAA